MAEKQEKEEKKTEETEKPEKTAEKKTEKEKTEKKEEKKEKPEKKAEKKEEKKEDNIIYIGKKPSMAYVMAIVTQFGSRDDVIIKARGRSISKAVDVAEIVKNKFVKDADIKNIKTGTDKITTDEGKDINVSSIDIELGK